MELGVGLEFGKLRVNSVNVGYDRRYADAFIMTTAPVVFRKTTKVFEASETVLSYPTFTDLTRSLYGLLIWCTEGVKINSA